MIRIEWDENKNRSNRRKHGVSFEEAAQVFFDPLHASDQDRMEGGEQRWQTIGMSTGFMVLVVAHTTTDYDEEGRAVEVIRIISARRAERKERRRYEGENS
jgi:uncharacterized protein